MWRTWEPLSLRDDMGFTSESDMASVYESNGHVNDLYFLDNNNNFLDVTFKKSIKVSNYETDKFIKSVDILKNIMYNKMLGLVI